jgi:hypothetical protein
MIVLVLTWLGIGCWVACFWWMHRISSRQESMPEELREMTQRIERLSEAGHELIRDVHPQVGRLRNRLRR